ncbi:MAG: alcohol dehydrogenase catalytic domain-containing protein, partial [Phycisphaerae bacterium]|nr:alcohol dehydrogenase catalytic domain-containing protein [Phycisphaerae bacterium]
MKACVFDGSLRVAENHPEPRRRNGEALIRVDLAGICRTDLEIVKGYMNFTGILGHEFVGTVVDGKNAGQRVVGDINCVCGRCEMCQAGLRSHCPNRTVLGIKGHDGAMAQYLALPEVNLQSVPDNVSDEQAVFVEPLAAAFQVMRQHAFDKRQKVVVLGDGRLGQLVAQVLQAAGYSPVVIGKHPNKL